MSSNLVPTGTRPIPALDGIRFLAVLLVILHHLTRGSHSSFLLHLIGMQSKNGIGPTLFFVLSGVLLTTVIINTRRTEDRYGNFLLRRVLRIFPLYFTYLILGVIVTWIWVGIPPRNIWVFAFFLQNTFEKTASTTGTIIPLFHFWTLAVQDQFYILWPLLIWKCDSNRKMRYLCYAGIVLSLLARVLIAHPSITAELFGRTLPSRAGEMCLGALIALEARERTALTAILRRSLLPVALACGLWMWHGLDFSSALGSIFGLQLIAIASAGLIVFALNPTSWAARVLGSKYFALGGKKLAFAMYILHPVVLETCMHLPLASKALRLGIFVVSTVVLSALSYRYCESPLLHSSIGRAKQSPAEVPSGLTAVSHETSPLPTWSERPSLLQSHLLP